MELIKIHSDERRSIDLVKDLLPNNEEFTFIRLNKGKGMGGCYHSVDEYFVVISGSVLVWIGDNMKIFNAGDSGTFPKNTSHAFIGLTDCIVSEWGVTTAEKVENKKDNEMVKWLEKLNG